MKSMVGKTIHRKRREAFEINTQYIGRAATLLIQTARFILMRRSTTTSIIHGQYPYRVPPCLLSRARSCVYLHPSFSTTPYIADHDEWSMCQSTHVNDTNEYACHHQHTFAIKKRFKIIKNNKITRQTNVQINLYLHCCTFFLDFLGILATPIPLAKSLVIMRYVRNTTHLAIAIGWLYTFRSYLAICNTSIGIIRRGS